MKCARCLICVLQHGLYENAEWESSVVCCVLCDGNQDCDTAFARAARLKIAMRLRLLNSILKFKEN
jgi:hypothetical protein